MGRKCGRAGTARGAAAAVLAIPLGLGLATDARAQGGDWADGRLYVGLNAPAMFVDDTESTTTGTQTAFPQAPPPWNQPDNYEAKSTSEYETGFKIAGVVGYEFAGGLRLEGELFIARAEVETVTYRGVVTRGGTDTVPIDVPIRGSAEQFGGFANLWYDVRTGTDWIPFIGGGLGFVRIDQGDLKYNANDLYHTILARSAENLPTGVQLPPLGPTDVPEISRRDTVFAYHFGAGIGYRLDDNAILQLGYRWQAADDLAFNARNEYGSVDVQSAMRVHFLEIGVRYRF